MPAGQLLVDSAHENRVGRRCKLAGNFSTVVRETSSYRRNDSRVSLCDLLSLYFSSEARTKEAPIEFVASGVLTGGRSLPHCRHRRRRRRLSSSRSLTSSRDSSPLRLSILSVRQSRSISRRPFRRALTPHHHVYSFSIPHANHRDDGQTSETMLTTDPQSGLISSTGRAYKTERERETRT